MPDITCPVCKSVNASTRTFCWKCAADLHAVVADPNAPPPPPEVEVPLRPVLIGGGIALAAIALIALLVVALGGTPAATTAPSAGPSGASSAAPGSGGGSGASGPPTFVAPTSVAPTAVAPTDPPPPTAAPPATPKVTPVPKPTIVSFTGPPSVDCTDPGNGGLITLSWVVDNADGASLAIDGPGVYQTYMGAQRSELVPFSCGNVQHTYTLTTIGGPGAAATKTLTIREQ